MNIKLVIAFWVTMIFAIALGMYSLQKQINELKIQTETKVNTLDTKVSSIINGTTNLKDTKISGKLTVDSLRVLSTITTP